MRYRELAKVARSLAAVAAQYRNFGVLATCNVMT